MKISAETIFDTRDTPWDGLGTKIEDAPCSEEALKKAGLDWNVVQELIFTGKMELINGCKVNIRDTDRKPLGMVSDKYKVVQNRDAFAFTDNLLGEGVRYETAGSLQNGKRVWLLARMPHDYIIFEDEFIPYLLFFNTHDGSGAVKVALTPIRVACKNALNFALKTARRSWSMVHTGNIMGKISEAEQTLLMAKTYMDRLEQELETLQKIKLTDTAVQDYIEKLLPLKDDSTPRKTKNVKLMQEDMKQRYFDAPDLQGMEKNAYRFLNAVSDFATHASPLRESENHKENLFLKTVVGNPLIDSAYQMVKTA